MDLAKGVHKGDDGARCDVGIELIITPGGGWSGTSADVILIVHDCLPAAGHPESSELWGSTVARFIRSCR